MAEAPEIEVKLSVDMAAVAQPGDTLVVALNRTVSDEEFETLRERFEPLKSSGIRVFLVENASSMVVVKGGDSAAPATVPGIVSPTEYATAQALLNLAGVPEGVRGRQVGGDHYRKRKIQHWDIAEEYELTYFEGAVLKYILRHRDKNGVEDLKKALHTLEKLIEVEEGKLRGQGTSDHEGSES